MVGLIKDRYHAEPWIVLHGWPIGLMSRWIRWVSSYWNIGMDWSSIVIDCRLFRWFQLSHNRPRLWALPMYRSSSTLLIWCNSKLIMPSLRSQNCGLTSSNKNTAIQSSWWKDSCEWNNYENELCTITNRFSSRWRSMRGCASCIAMIQSISLA